ncbi:MAG: hypothetical protein ACT4PT_06720 [Methanobacteriota archaeon]
MMSLAVDWFTNVPHRDYDRMPGSVWLRCLQLFDYLAEHGIRSSYNELSGAARIACFVRWQDGNARELAEKLKGDGRRIVFDLNVNYLEPSDVPHLGTPVGERHVAECLAMIEVADVVTCASPFIAERVRAHHKRAEVFDDSIDIRHFARVKPPTARRPPRALWNGYSQKALELCPILPLLEERRIPLVVVTDKPPPLRRAGGWLRRRFPYEFVPWRYATFPEALLRGDLCVAPRQLDQPYNLGHSIIKIGLPMAEGLPAIADPVPSYGRLLSDGGGHLCRDLDDWASTLDRLLADPALLPRWSAEAREATKPFHTDVIAARYARLFRDLAGADAS